MSNPYYLTLGQAAKLAKVAKSTITRAIEKGQLSVAQRVGNGYRIDPAELQRWQGTRANTRVRTQPMDGQTRLDATADTALSIQVRNAQLEAEIGALKKVHAQMEDANSELKAMTEKMLRDKDKEIDRLYTLALTDQRDRQRKGFWPNLFGGKGRRDAAA